MADRNRLRTDPEIVRNVLAMLETRSQYAVALRTGITQTTVREWRHRAMREPTGWPTDDDIREWRRDTAEKAAARATATRKAKQILWYRKTTGHGRKVPNTGTVRRLRALCAIGWTQEDIGDRLGVSRQMVSILTRGIHPLVFVGTRDAVTALYDELSMTIPTHRHLRVHNRQRADAIRKGWAVPLAWDDDDLDNPNATPYGQAAA